MNKLFFVFVCAGVQTDHGPEDICFLRNILSCKQSTLSANHFQILFNPISGLGHTMWFPGLQNELMKCFDFFSITIPVSEDTPISALTITIYPNPTSYEVKISCSEKVNALEVYNTLGEKLNVDSNLNDQLTYTVNFSNKQKGIYFAKVYCGDRVFTKKIVFQ